MLFLLFCFFFFFFFNDTATTEIYTLSLHDALPIFLGAVKFNIILDLNARGAVSGDEFLTARFGHGNPLFASIFYKALWKLGSCLMLLPRQGQSIKHEDRKSTRLNSSHVRISYAVFC